MLMVAFYSFHIMIRGFFKYFYAVFFVFLFWETTNNFQFLWWFENVFSFFHYLLISVILRLISQHSNIHGYVHEGQGYVCIQYINVRESRREHKTPLGNNHLISPCSFQRDICCKLSTIWLSNRSILSVSDEGYSRNAPCTLNLISTFLLWNKWYLLQ
jgi:hypothetical protein